MKPLMTEIGDLFKQRYDIHFDTPYEYRKADFVQLAVFIKKHPEITAVDFVTTAESDWKNGQYKSTASLSIAGVCAGWSRLKAKQQTSVKQTVETKKGYRF